MNAPHPVLHELVRTNRLTTDEADTIFQAHCSAGKSVRDIVIEQGYLNEADYLTALAGVFGTEVVNISASSFPEMGKIVPAGMLRMYAVLPFRMDGNTAVFAAAEWPGPSVTDDLAFVLSRKIGYVAAPKKEVEGSILKLYKGTQKKAYEPLDSGENCGSSETDPAPDAAPVVRFVHLVLDQAVKDHASDIHFEPFEHKFNIRCRVDGTLYEMTPPPKHLAMPIISRIKVMAGLDIAESHLPQDGRIRLHIGKRPVDFRVSTLPTRFGESVVLRVLDRSEDRLDIKRIGFPEDICRCFLKDIREPNGIVLLTGPTGSGKTTTLYAALQHINQVETKILTAEDPVEHDMEGIIQLPIKEEINLSFAAALHAFLRQDPDIVMVGEIRDFRTAQITIQASLTGHLVFSTLHTNDAPGVVTRLMDMGIEPFLIASTLKTVMAQRLVRSICPDCQTAYRPDEHTLALLGLNQRQIGDRPFYRGAGCKTCNHSGYRGRQAIFEYMRINDALRSAIIERPSTMEFRDKAMELGMRTLRENGIRCILDGYSTIEEVARYV